MKQMVDFFKSPPSLVLAIIHWPRNFIRGLRDDPYDAVLLISIAIIIQTFKFWFPWLCNYTVDHTVGVTSFLENQRDHKGMFYEYQNIVAAAVALLAGTLALATPVISHILERYKTRQNLFRRLLVVDTSLTGAITAFLKSENPFITELNLNILRNTETGFLTTDNYWASNLDESHSVHAIHGYITETKRWIQMYDEGVASADAEPASSEPLVHAIFTACHAVIRIHDILPWKLPPSRDISDFLALDVKQLVEMVRTKVEAEVVETDK